VPSSSGKPSTDPEGVYRRVYADTHLLLLIFFGAVLVAAPALLPRLLGEDGWVEIPTALLAAAAAVLAFLAAARAGPGRLRARCVTFGALYVLVVGEENDWGIRLFVRRNMVDGDGDGPARAVNLNTIHELLFEVGPAAGADTTWRVVAVAVAVLIAAAAAAVLLTGMVKLWPPDRRTWDRGQRLTLTGFVLLALGQLRDLGLTPQIGLGPKFPEEVLELFGAVSLFFAGWSLYLAAGANGQEVPPRGRGAWAAVRGFLTEP
jgi:hypothetical protein